MAEEEEAQGGEQREELRKAKVAAPTDDLATDDAVLADLLVEEVSIDGMCGVY